MTALEAYKEFEFIHPFEDGNGRTGKIILNWINGTLLDPIFPPNDIFGYEISNP
jgi:fido (protein-threonine AMPylation protein)